MPEPATPRVGGQLGSAFSRETVNTLSGKVFHTDSDQRQQGVREYSRTPWRKSSARCRVNDEQDEMNNANTETERPEVLLVDDNDMVRTSLKAVLEREFRVTAAANVTEALHFINTEPFDLLLSDLHMPGAGDGFTVVSAMRHTNPEAVTLVFSAFPALKEAMAAILLQADEVLLKPMPVVELLAVLREKLEKREPRKMTNTERVAAILERDATSTITDWLFRVEREDELTCIPLSKEQRTGHLRIFFRNWFTGCACRGNLGRSRCRKQPFSTARFAAHRATRFR